MKHFLKNLWTGLLLSLGGVTSILGIATGVMMLIDLHTYSGWTAILMFILAIIFIALGVGVLYIVGLATENEVEK